MQGSTSKYRNVYADASKDKFEDVKPNETTTEGSLIDVNAHFVAVSWASRGGGNVAVFDATNKTRLMNELPLLRGHTGPVLDVKFSPFRSNLLATASDDSTVRLWEIPEGGLQEDITVEQQKFNGHSRKVGLMAFNPCVSEVIASASFDHSLHTWNIINGESLSKVQLKDSILCLDWNRDGSKIGLTTKAKMVQIIDPRASQVELSTNGHESGKVQKMRFLNDNFLFTCGFNRMNERQLKLFDMRKFETHVQQLSVDTQTGIFMPFYDEDLSLIYLPGRGEGNIKSYEFTNDSIKFASEYRSNTPQKGIACFPKRTMNYNKCEIERFAKMTNQSIEYLSFYVPRRNEGYDSAIYPDCFAGEPAIGVEEWLKGENKQPIKKNITSMENNWKTSQIAFEKNEEPKEEKASDDNSDKLEEYLTKINQLENSLSESIAKVDLLTNENSQLLEQVSELKNQVSLYKEKSNDNNGEEIVEN